MEGCVKEEVAQAVNCGIVRVRVWGFTVQFC